jgi:hypothetical protein
MHVNFRVLYSHTSNVHDAQWSKLNNKSISLTDHHPVCIKPIIILHQCWKILSKWIHYNRTHYHHQPKTKTCYIYIFIQFLIHSTLLPIWTTFNFKTTEKNGPILTILFSKGIIYSSIYTFLIMVGYTNICSMIAIINQPFFNFNNFVLD